MKVWAGREKCSVLQWRDDVIVRSERRRAERIVIDRQWMFHATWRSLFPLNGKLKFKCLTRAIGVRWLLRWFGWGAAVFVLAPASHMQRKNFISSGCVARAGVTIAKRVLSHFESSETRLSGTHTRSLRPSHSQQYAQVLVWVSWTASNTQIRDSAEQHSNKLLAGIMLWQCSLDFSVICIVIIWFYFVFRLVSYISISFLCPIHGSAQFNRIP